MDIGTFMSNIADFYDDICTPCSDERIRFLHHFIEKNLCEGSSVLDEACSTGETLLNLCLSNYYKLTGIDFSTGMIKKCQEKGFNRRIDFLVDDMRYLNHLQHKVDLIYNNSIVWLAGIGEIEQTFRRAYEVLNSGGWLIIDTNNSETFFKGKKKLCSACVITDEYEIYKTTLFHNLKKGYSATQIYTRYNYKKDIIESYASLLHWTICDKESICELIEKVGFKLIEMHGDYKADKTDNASYLQYICKKES